MDFLETGLCACEAIGLDPDGHHDHIKRPQPVWGRQTGAGGSSKTRAPNQVASRGPTRPQMAAARAGSPAKL